MIALVVSLLMNLPMLSYAGTQDPLLGTWFYVGFIYEGNEYPRPNPNLKMYFSFFDTQKVRLYYRWDDEQGFCHRVASYQYKVPIEELYQKVEWVDERNMSKCSADSDMQLNKETLTHVRFLNGRMLLDLPLGDKILTMLWVRHNEDQYP